MNEIYLQALLSIVNNINIIRVIDLAAIAQNQSSHVKEILRELTEILIVILRESILILLYTSTTVVCVITL